MRKLDRADLALLLIENYRLIPMLRIGSDDMYSVEGKCRNRKIMNEQRLYDLLRNNYDIYLEEDECTEKKLIFHAMPK